MGPTWNQAGMKTEIVWMFTWDRNETPCEHFALIQHYEHVWTCANMWGMYFVKPQTGRKIICVYMTKMSYRSKFVPVWRYSFLFSCRNALRPVSRSQLSPCLRFPRSSIAHAWQMRKSERVASRNIKLSTYLPLSNCHSLNNLPNFRSFTRFVLDHMQRY